MVVVGGGAGLGWRAAAWMEGWAWGSGLDGGMEGAGRGGVEGWRGLSGWRDRTAQTEPHKPNCKKNRTETKAKPIPETETNRNEPRLYCSCCNSKTVLSRHPSNDPDAQTCKALHPKQQA